MNIRAPNGNDADFMKWIANLLRLVFYVGAISTAVWFVFSSRQLQLDSDRRITVLEQRVADMRSKQEESTQRRWKLLQQADNRMRRLYEKNGWEYQELEP